MAALLGVVVAVLTLLVTVFTSDWVKGQQQIQVTVELLGKFNWLLIGKIALECFLTVLLVWGCFFRQDPYARQWPKVFALGFGLIGSLNIWKDVASLLAGGVSF